MKRRRAEESADGLALMTSSVTSSQSADGLSPAVASYCSPADVASFIDPDATQRYPVAVFEASAVAQRKQYDLQRMFARIWKEDKLPISSAEQIWNLSNGHISNRGYIFEKHSLKKCSAECKKKLVVVQLRDDVGASTILWEIFIDYTVHQQRKNNLK
ncbi:chaperone protein dnaJ 16-like [Dorcoceras hygrometricum]|uniref:Chaperone protein dnaJ 16-like n=1 Tax=Dorcoceras hygrometricum TaxID=472368 RepID=A0A2Z7AWJ6_9LAMI|nr:chaperone protein dnaJ 16-like [Dorcoceras hygrometricum]